MKFDENLASVHAYLCADGYVVKNPLTQKHKYYRIGLRNINIFLLKDFQDKFEKVFGIKPRLVEGQRCEIGSREIYELLSKEFGSFYSREWQMPPMKTDLLPFWLRSFFDCEGWVYIQSHQNRQIGLDCVNEKSLDQVRKKLSKLGIRTTKQIKKNGAIFRILVLGKENLLLFKEKIGFFHPEKKEKLEKAIKDYVIYLWDFPRDEFLCKKFIKKLLTEKIRIRGGNFISIISKEAKNLDNLSKILKKFYDIDCLVRRRINGLGTIYYELSIYKKEEVRKLIKARLVNNFLKNVQRKTQKN